MNHLKKLSLYFMVPAIVLIINGNCIAKTNSDPDGDKITWGPELSFRIAKFTGSTAKDWDTKSLGTIGFGGYIHWHFLEDLPQLGLPTNATFIFSFKNLIINNFI